MKEDIISRIAALRDRMRGAGIEATIVPQTDPHMGEYLAEHWQVRRWLSGFTGSAGSLVVTLDKAYVWADSRYWLQAAAQLEGTPIGVMEDGKPQTPDIIDFLCETLPAGATVGVDGAVFSMTEARSMESKLEHCGKKLRVDFDPVAGLWIDRPALPSSEVFIHEEKYAGESAGEKMDKVLKQTEAAGADSIFISDLAEVAWILNLRSSDVSCNPVLTSFLYLAPQGSALFIDKTKVTPEVNSYLAGIGVTVQPYNSALEFLNALPSAARVLVNPSQTSSAVFDALGSKAVEGVSPVALFKAVKNPVQIAGFRAAMERDGAALVAGVMELEERLAAGEQLTEITVDEILTAHRRKSPMFFDLSFDTIAGYGANGAIVHYSARPETAATLKPEGLLLIDSGVNYFDGTTDITRTIALGKVSDQMRRDFTLVMKGHIALATAEFPEGTSGAQLDVLARISLWKHGLSYGHGTGHGVGHFLNVHEGPQRIALTGNPAPLMPGMVTSDEPGVYRAGEYGIRCENLILTIPAETTEFGNFYKFEVLTLFPFDLRLFDTSIMTDDEIAWVNNYHETVRARLLPYLDEKQARWLETHTAVLTR